MTKQKRVIYNIIIKRKEEYYDYSKRAKELYNEVLLVRDKYIEEVIEPLIKENATMSQSVSVRRLGDICQN